MAQPALTASVTTPVCNNNGVITVTASGLVPPISYTYTNPYITVPIVHSNMGSNIDNLQNIAANYFQWSNANTYYVYASDGTNFAADTVVMPMPFNFVVSTFTGTCPFPSTISVGSFTGGTAPFTYTFTNTSSNASYFGNPALVPTGAYNLVVMDGAGCKVSSVSNGSTSIYAYQTPSYFANITGAPANCTNGTATVTTSGGVAPFTYLWNNNASTSAIGGLSAGPIYCTITDATGCQVIVTYSVPQTISITYNASIVNATCLQNNGSVTSIVGGGQAPYLYQWSNFATSQNLTNVPAGNYSVQITDLNGCKGWGYATVISTSPIYVNVSTAVSQCTAATGAATLQANGGTAPYSYVWYLFPTNTSGTTISNKAPGNYAFKVTDAVGCVNTGVVTIAPVSTMSLSINLPSVICPVNSANLYASAVSSNPPLTYLWSNAAVTPSINANVGTAYTCTVTDAVGCKLIKSSSVQSYPGLSLSFSTTPTNCQYAANGSIMVVPSGAAGPYTYQWNNNQTTQTATGLGVGNYNVVVTAANGCSTWSYTGVTSNNTSNSCYCVVQGTVYQDNNLNCVQNAGEPGIANVAVHIPGVGYAYTNSAGVYQMFVPSGSYTLTEIVPQYFPLAACNSATVPLVASAGTNCTLTANFAHGVIPASDLRVVLTSMNYAVPGNVYNQKIILSNDGSFFENNVKYAYNRDGLLNYLGCTPISLNQPNATGFPNNYRINSGMPTMNPNTSIDLTISHSVQPTTPLGTLLIYSDTIANNNPLQTNWTLDQTPWNNYNYYTTTVRSSYDPNFKEVSPQGQGNEGFIGVKDSILTYVVHFQNTGSYFAQNVVVIDTLDPSLRISSLKPGYSDHRFKVEMSDNGVVKYTFAGINLPWKSQYGDALSSGMFTYSVRMKKNLAMGTKIKNRAFIYFDYNAPIITNTTLNTLREEITTGVNAKEAAFITASAILYPNPTVDGFSLRFINKNACDATLSLFDISGRELSTRAVSLSEGDNILSESTSDLKSGIYFVILKSADFSIEKKVVVAK